MADPANDFIGTGRFAFNNPAANRRELINGGDLLKDRSVPPKKLARETFPPDIRPGPSGEKPSFHDEPGKDAHEKGVPRSVGDPSRLARVARDDHNHDFTYHRVGMTQVIQAAPSDYTAPFYDAGEGPHPAATPDEPHKRIANWSVYPDYADRIKGGPIEVWTETSLDGGATYGEPVLRAVAPPGAISAEYEDRDVDWDPNTYVQVPVVRVYVKPVNHDKSPILKVPRAGVDGKLDPDWLPSSATAGRFLGRTVVTATGTFTTGASTTKIRVRVYAAGGGGGGAASAVVSAAAAGGGGAGAFAEKDFTVTPSTGYAVVVGAAGAAGANTGGNGGDGGLSSIVVGATTVSAPGGIGGAGDSAGTSLTATRGGPTSPVATGGDLNSAGAPGDYGTRISGILGASGNGGSGPVGAGGGGLTTGGAGIVGFGYGAGGGGALVLNGGTAQVGGAGAAGVICVDEFS